MPKKSKALDIDGLADIELEEPSVESATLTCDKELLELVLDNMLQNGLKKEVSSAFTDLVLNQEIELPSVIDEESLKEDKYKLLLYSLKEVYEILNSLPDSIFSGKDSRLEIVKAFSVKHNWITSDIKADEETGKIKPFLANVK